VFMRILSVRDMSSCPPSIAEYAIRSKQYFDA
jgi:hypothetical protein